MKGIEIINNTLKKMRKILFVTSDLSYGGAEKMLCFVAEKMEKKGDQVAIANMLEIEYPERPLSDSIKVFRIESSNIRFLEKIQKFIRLKKCVRIFKPDIIVSFKTVQNTLSSLVGKCEKVPVIISERGDPTRENLRRLRTIIHWKLINSAEGAVFQTNGAKSYFTEDLQSRSAVIANPIEVANELRNSNESKEKAVVSFGRFENEQKRYDVMVKAFEFFHKIHPDYVLKLYGNGKDETAIREWIKECHLDKYVYFMGYANKPSEQMKNGNIFLITSDYEGISNALLEAMAAGYPVVSTDSSPGGARMVLKDHINGLLVPTQDVEGIGKALCEYAEDENLYSFCGENAKKIADEYSTDIIAEKWNEYINVILTEYRRKK